MNERRYVAIVKEKWKAGVGVRRQATIPLSLCRVVFGPTIKWSGRTNKSIRPDHNIPFEMIPLKLNIDTKHRLLMLITCNVDEYIFRTFPRTSAIYLQRALLV